MKTSCRGPFHWHFCQCNWILKAISFCFDLNSNITITAKFCTWHDSRAVITCGKICSNRVTRNGIVAKLIYQLHLNTNGTASLQWVPDESMCHNINKNLTPLLLFPVKGEYQRQQIRRQILFKNHKNDKKQIYHTIINVSRTITVLMGFYKRENLLLFTTFWHVIN